MQKKYNYNFYSNINMFNYIFEYIRINKNNYKLTKIILKQLLL